MFRYAASDGPILNSSSSSPAPVPAASNSQLITAVTSIFTAPSGTALSGGWVSFSPWLAYRIKQCLCALNFNSLSNFQQTIFLICANRHVIRQSNAGLFFSQCNIRSNIYPWIIKLEHPYLEYWSASLLELLLCFQYRKSPKALFPAYVYTN